MTDLTVCPWAVKNCVSPLFLLPLVEDKVLVIARELIIIVELLVLERHEVVSEPDGRSLKMHVAAALCLVENFVRDRLFSLDSVHCVDHWEHMWADHLDLLDELGGSRRRQDGQV